MTSGGTLTRAQQRRQQPRPPWLRWVDDPRLLHHLPTLAALAVYVGCWARWRQRWLIPGRSSYLLDVHATVVDGVGIAPNQYRPLMPLVDFGLADMVGVAVPQAILAVDTLLAAVAAVAVWRVCVYLNPERAPMLALGAAAGFAWLSARLDHWSPETWLLIALAAIVARELARPDPEWLTVTACAVTMCGARTDYTATLGVTLVVLAVVRRQWLPGLLGALYVAAGAAATELWREIYPQAAYQVDVVQLPFNLSLGSWLQVVPWYAPLLAAPLLLVLRDRAWPPLWPVLAWFAVQFAAVFVVGRVEESRLFMPFAALLGVAAVAAWLRLRPALDDLTGAEGQQRHRP